MRGIDISRGGQYGGVLEEIQRRPLGDIVVDNSGREWVYGRFDQTLSIGDLVRDAVTDDLVTPDSSQVYASITTAAAVGTNYLTDSGAFTDKKFVGAIGDIVAGDGLGQKFSIIRMVDANRVEIEVLAELSSLVDSGDEGWQTALTTSSKYVLALPGAFFQGDEASAVHNYVNRGFVQQAIDSDHVGWYGFVCKKGLCLAKVARSSNPIVPYEFIVPAGSGAIQGASATITIDDVMNKVGRALADLTGTGSALTIVEADCPGIARALALPDDMKDPLTGIRIP